MRQSFVEYGTMAKSIYVGNLPFNATEEDVKALFSQYGTVRSIKLITDRDTGRPRGFGFVTWIPRTWRLPLSKSMGRNSMAARYVLMRRRRGEATSEVGIVSCKDFIRRARNIDLPGAS